ncbi:MAG TPA: T9SS type A sorting domain-containing protein [Flavobacteriales bacterium]|nr:T9SS type A sorting domain-containing protein [Flavobacteriales bacterium]HQV39338.1 T9SS type A sorting domain-containing protein [Flavobacteriales bacterium]HQW32181.1 T9SS type A sorting domain-containing protein [Flavobacteriales bacterium]HQY78443.1 T9SS type A sorting domain-containing protein [Flavobacteriales bacterium]
MNLPVLLKSTALAGSLFLLGTGLKAQGCINDLQYPSNTILPDPLGAVTSIDNCSYFGDYSVVGPAVAGGSYTFAVETGGYVTVREGAVDGTVIAQGNSPLVATATVAGDLYVHWNADSLCATSTGCLVTTVQFMLDCTPPVATVVAVDDCDNNQFSITVNVTSIGDGTSVDLIYSVDGGADQTMSAPETGSYNIGPFTVGQVVNLTVAHSSDPLCNIHFNGLVSGNTCATIIQCGGAPLDETYCYVNSDNNHWHWQSSGGEALIAIFSAGMIESATYDHLRIYDGPDNTGTLLYDHTMLATEDLAGLQVVAPSGEMYMENSSDGSVSCATNTAWEWAWQVGCLDCTPATATYTVITDCDNFQFSVEVHITDLGSDGTLDISVDSLGTVLATATDTGVYTVGPFTANIPVVITLANSDNSLCNVHSTALVNPLCPQIIQCGDPAITETYCYGINDVHAWHWQAANSGDILSLRFLAGTIQASFGDHLRIYDGPDNTGPLLFDHTATAVFNLTDLQVTSSGQDIYMEMTSDGFGSCSSGATTEWEWIVGCADCTAPEATYTVVTDCDNFQFSVDVDITAMGSNPNINITNDGGALPVVASATGIYTVGPFTANIPVTVTLADDVNVLCSVHSAPLVNPLCPTPVVCGGPPLDETYCYTDNDSHTWHWQSSGGEALILIFSTGMIESASYDHLRIYDGPDNTSTPVYDHIGPTEDLAGLQVIAASGHIYMENSSDGSVSCSTNAAWEWVWQVGCLDCTPPQATYTVVPDCDLMQYNVEVNIALLGSDTVVDITNDGGALPVAASAEGTYTVGPFPAGTTTVITLENDVNPLCSVHSAPLTNPLCPTIVDCGGATLNETYCYTNNDNHEWHWQSSGGQPLAIQFSAGTIESATFDHLTIYDGPDVNSDILYNHVGTVTEDLAGLLVISTGADLYMTNTSDGIVSCESGNETEWAWEVGCLDCTNPGATYTMVEDCIHHSFSIEVNVDSTGSGSFVRIANSLSTDTLTNIMAGMNIVGPFPMDSTVTLTVMNETNNLCRVYSPAFTSPSMACVDSVCAAEAYEYCYTNQDTAWFLYQGTENVPLTIQFLWGQLLADDFVQVYDGPSPIPTDLLWQGNLNGNMAGFAINTTNIDHVLLMRVVSNGAGSCATGQATVPLHWVVQCGAVGVHEIPPSDFSMYPNPTTGDLSIVLPMIARGTADMRIIDIAGRTVHQQTFNNTGGVNNFDLNGLHSGNYTVTITTNDWVKTQRLQIVH